MMAMSTIIWHVAGRKKSAAAASRRSMARLRGPSGMVLRRGSEWRCAVAPLPAPKRRRFFSDPTCGTDCRRAVRPCLAVASWFDAARRALSNHLLATFWLQHQREKSVPRVAVLAHRVFAANIIKEEQQQAAASMAPFIAPTFQITHVRSAAMTVAFSAMSHLLPGVRLGSRRVCFAGRANRRLYAWRGCSSLPTIEVDRRQQREAAGAARWSAESSVLRPLRAPRAAG